MREAIRAANAQAGTNTIILPAGTYTLTISGGDDAAANGDLDITDTVTLTGAGAQTTVIRGGSSFNSRIFQVFTATVQISGVTIQNGNVSSGGGLNITSGGKLTLTNVAVVSNTTTNTGGGIYNTGALTLTASAVVSNTATGASSVGGGITNAGGTLTLTNVTLSGNAARGNGGGLSNRSDGMATLQNVTVTNNTADSDADNAGNGGGVSRESGTVSVRNTIISGNFDTSPITGTVHPNASGTFVSQGYNLIGVITGTSSFTATGDLTNTNALLGPLQNNGGPTLTHALLSGSPAINAGTNTGCPVTDQRGVARPIGSACDIGSYEFATIFTVSKTADTNDGACNADCSLREAIRAANSDAGASAIILPAGTYLLTRAGTGEDAAATGDLDITGDLTLTGAGADSTVVDGGGLDRVFHILGVTAQISGMTIRNGNSGSSHGGGVRDETGSVLTLTNATVSGNTTTGNGGGIYNPGTLTLSSSAVINNTALGTGGTGGGLNNYGGAATLINVTLSGNQANTDGGGLSTNNGGATNLTNVTLTNNTADADANGSGDGGGVRRGSSGVVTINVKNTLIAGNADSSASPKDPDCVGVLTSQGYNLLGNNTGCTFTPTTGDQVGTGSSPINALLGPLQDNGGPTFTHALQIGSPAINAGTNTGCPATDQRGVARPQGTTCDIGAYEFVAATPTPTPTPTSTPSPSPTPTSTPTSNVCVNGSGSPLSFNPNDVQFGIANPIESTSPRRLTTLPVGWNNAALKLISVKMGTITIWSNPAGSLPLTINSGDWISDTETARTINPSTSKSLWLTYNSPTYSETFTLGYADWMSTTDGTVCQSAPITVTRGDP